MRTPPVIVAELEAGQDVGTNPSVATDPLDAATQIRFLVEMVRGLKRDLAAAAAREEALAAAHQARRNDPDFGRVLAAVIVADAVAGDRNLPQADRVARLAREYLDAARS